MRLQCQDSFNAFVNRGGAEKVQRLLDRMHKRKPYRAELRLVDGDWLAVSVSKNGDTERAAKYAGM